VNSLRDDVHKPLSKMKDFYYAQNKSFNNSIKSNIQSLKKQQNEFTKIKAKYDKVMGHSDVPKAQHSKKQHSKKQQLLNVKRRFTQQQLVWKRQREVHDQRMTSTLRSMESNEYKRTNALRDALTNWSAFITNYCANRTYDIRFLAQSMSQMDPEQDLQIFMKLTLSNYPALPPFGGPFNGDMAPFSPSPGTAEYEYPGLPYPAQQRVDTKPFVRPPGDAQSSRSNESGRSRKGSATEYLRGYFQRNSARRMSSSQSTTQSMSSQLSTLSTYTPSVASDGVATPEQLQAAVVAMH